MEYDSLRCSSLTAEYLGPKASNEGTEVAEK